MKKSILIIFIIGLSVNASAQLNNGDIALSLDGMYSRTSNYTGVYNNSLSGLNSTFTTGASVSFIQNHFLFGFGLDYFHQSETKLSIVNFQDIYFQMEQDFVNSFALLPNVHVGYYYSVVKNLYFTANLKLATGVLTSQTLGSTYTQGQQTDNPNLSIQQISEKTIYSSAGLHPEFTYYFNKKFGVSLYPGGIDYSFVNWNTASSNLIFNINPGNWLVGVKYVF